MNSTSNQLRMHRFHLSTVHHELDELLGERWVTVTTASLLVVHG